MQQPEITSHIAESLQQLRSIPVHDLDIKLGKLFTEDEINSAVIDLITKNVVRLDRHGVLHWTSGSPPPVGLYNTTVELWMAARPSYPPTARFIVAEGHLFALGAGGGVGEVVARFRDDAHACEVLRQAGFKREPSEMNLVFNPL